MQMLCVDDDPLWLGLLREMVYDVVGAEAQIHTAFTGAEALRVLDQFPCDLAIVDLSLCDIAGLDLVAKVHARWPSLPLVALSDGMDLGEVMRARSLGAAYCLLKPLSASSFADVCAALGLARAEAVRSAAL